MASGTQRRASSSAGDAALALALLLPAGLLLWPATLAGASTPQSMAAGLAILALLPAGLVLVARGLAPLPWLAWLWVPFLAFTAARLPAASDSFEARRAALVLVASFVCLLGGLRLGRTGRRWMRVGIVGCALAALVHAAWVREPGGATGNTGDLSEALLPGALIGIAWFAEGRPRGAWLGLLAALGFVLHAALVPVWTGAVAFGLVAILALVLSAGQPALGRYGRAGLLATLVLVVTAALGSGFLGSAGDDSMDRAGARAPQAHSASGLEVRKLLWGTVPAVLADHWGLGLGPGQFAATYPPYRDGTEIELSSHGRSEPTPVDVEHLHNDWLQGPVDFGLVAGGLWVLFLLGVAARSIATLLGSGTARRGAALGSLGVLIAATGNAPLLDPVVSHVLALPLFGILLGEDRAERPEPGARSRVLPALVLLLLGVSVPSALDLARHGHELQGLAKAVQTTETGRQQLDAGVVLSTTNAALEAAPDSAAALERRASLPTRDNAQRAADLEQLLVLRPHHRAGLNALGVRRAIAGDYGQACEHFKRALELDSRLPAALSGYVRASARGGLADELGEALFLLDQAVLPKGLAQGSEVDPDALRDLGLEVLRRGQFACAEQLLLRSDERLEVTDPNVCWNLGQEARRANDPPLEDALLTGFHLNSARSHMASGNPANAIRSFVQAQRFSGGTPEVLIEWAAALAADGRMEEAVATLNGIAPLLRASARPEALALERLRKEGLWPMGDG